MENENIIMMQDDQGNEMALEIIDSFIYEGQEYAVLAEPCDCDDEGNCADCGESLDVYVMQVNPIDDENDELVAIAEDKEAEVLAYADRYLAGDFDEVEE